MGDWLGWQCRWYELSPGSAIGASRRKKIEEAIRLTEKCLPDLTHWILWTRHVLTKSDQDWYFGLSSSMRLALWSTLDIESLLDGPADLLRQAYFGELTLTPETLLSIHKLSVAPVAFRWIPEVHQSLEAERDVRRYLAEPETWRTARDAAGELLMAERNVSQGIDDLPAAIQQLVLSVATRAREIRTVLIELYSALERGDLDALRELAAAGLKPVPASMIRIPHELRARRHPSALYVTNALFMLKRVCFLVKQLDEMPRTRMVAIIADAGCGKTELAISLTSGSASRPPGILLHGRELGTRDSLDKFARSVVIQGTPVQSMEALLAAVDAAGQRSGRRIPVVIDGLNEAEDHRQWRWLLEGLHVLLERFPYVLVVCTLRTEFARDTLPQEVRSIAIRDFGFDTYHAIEKYLKYFKIDFTDAALPIAMLRHPLTLRMFCEVTNPSRSHQVGSEAIPRSRVAIFERYIHQTVDRVVQLAPISARYSHDDVLTALDRMGETLWSSMALSLEVGFLRRQISDDRRVWTDSLIRLLQEQGLILKVRGPGTEEPHFAFLYDALGGHVVARALLAKNMGSQLTRWIQEPATERSLAGSLEDRHPLYRDILRGLVGLVPRNSAGQHVWVLANGPLRSLSLSLTAELEPAHLDAQTVEELSKLVFAPLTGEADPFEGFWRTRSAVGHPLNAEFLTAVLTPRSVATRDKRWSEWCRRNSDEIQKDIEDLKTLWRASSRRAPVDHLRALWVMWTLTSTIRMLRDVATRALYWFGRGDPAGLFRIAIESLKVNDAQVSERMLAASYGVVMANALPSAKFEESLSRFLIDIRSEFVDYGGQNAKSPTDHWLTRLYVQGCVSFARVHHPNAVPDGFGTDGTVCFVAAKSIEPVRLNDQRTADILSAMTAHYKNDTLDHIIGFRGSLNAVKGQETPLAPHLRGVLWESGWRETELGPIDTDISTMSRYRNGRGANRYAEKYLWIGLYTYPKMLDVYRGTGTRHRPSDLQIDPSFPDPSPPAPISGLKWALETPKAKAKWIAAGAVFNPDELFFVSELHSSSGPWIAVCGYLSTPLKIPGRGIFGLLRAFLVNEEEADRLELALQNAQYPGNHWLPDIPQDYYTFAGEIPWSTGFAREHMGLQDEHPYKSRVLLDEGSPIEVEVLAHEFAWEGYHSELNPPIGGFVPSRIFSRSFDLRGTPQSLDQRSPDGRKASASLSSPWLKWAFSGFRLKPPAELARLAKSTCQCEVGFAW